jgi:hypothetical protein
MSMPSRLLSVLLSGAALIVFALPAAAIEPEAAAQALATAIAGGTNAKVTFDSASEDGGNVVIAGLTVADGDGDGSIRFDETVIESPTDGGGGIFETPRVSFTAGAISGESTGSLANAELTEVAVLDPASIEGNAPAQGLLFKTAQANDLKVTRTDEPGELTIASVSVEIGNVVENVPQESKGRIEDITIPPEAFADSEMGPQTIGYDNLVLDVSWDGSRDAAAKTMTLRDFTLSVQDGGALSVSGIMGNLPAATALNDADAAAKAAAMEVHTVTVRYEDASLAGRILDLLAQQQGISREDYANQIAGALPFLLAAINNPEFQNEVAGAVGAFLKDPQSLTVKIQPDAPISANEIMGIATTAPQTLPDRLKASISANTAE